MKNLLTLLLVTGSVICYGQASFGIKAGLNLNDVKYAYKGSRPYDLNADLSIGFHVGAFFEAQLNEKFSFVPELQFNQRGWSNNLIPTGTVNFNMNYLELPLIISYAPIEKFSVDVGPGVSYLIAAKAKSSSSSRDFTDSQERLNIGLNAGVSYYINEKIAISGRYFYAITHAEEIEFRDENNFHTGSARNYLTSIQVGVSYNLRK